MYLMRIARDKESTGAEKVQAEASAWKILKEMTGILVSLGYVKTPATEGEEKSNRYLSSVNSKNTPEMDKGLIEDAKLLAPMERMELRNTLETKIRADWNKKMKEIEEG